MKIFTIVFISFFLFVKSSFAQTKSVMVKGVVTDQDTKESIPGVTIVLKGQTDRVIGTTNRDGNYSVTVPQNATLSFSYIGYTAVTAKIPANNTLNIRLKSSDNALAEVVIRGFQNGTRETSTGSSTVISGKDLQENPVSNAEQLLQGRVAGLNIQQNTGSPGFRGSVALRGISNIDISGDGNDSYLSPTSPLYVIDGVPTDVDPATADALSSGGASPLSLIPQEDIASIEVLKDAQATSLYGSRGAYGVILITTRRGQSKVPRVRYTTNFFVNTPPALRQTLGGKAERDIKMQQILTFGSDADKNIALAGSGGQYLTDSLNAYYKNSTDWQSIFYASTFNQSHNIGVDGGDETFNYKTNFGYYDENGIQKNTGFTRYTLSSNMEYKPSKKFSIFGQVSGGVAERQKANSVGIINTGIATSSAASTVLPGPSLYLATNDVLQSLNVKNSNPTKSFLTNLTATLKPYKGLIMTTTGSYNIVNSTNESFLPAAANYQYSQVDVSNDSKTTLYNRNLISYSKNFNKVHDFSISGFNEIYIRSYQLYSSRQYGLPDDTYLGPFGYNGTYEKSRGGGLRTYTRDRAASFAGSFSYNYKKRFVFDFTYRADATSTSGIDDPFTKSPAFGFRWNIKKQDDKLKGFSWLDYTSLRLTWGTSTAPTATIYDVYGTYEPKGYFNGAPTIGLNTTRVPNANLGSALSTTYNAGFDFGLFNGKLNVITDTYYRRVDRQPRSLDLSNIAGFSQVLSDQVSIGNYGTEVSVTVRPLAKTSKVSWNLNVNGAIQKDVLAHLPGGAGQVVFGSTVFKVGRNTLSNYIFQNNGVYSTTANVPIDPVTGMPLRNGTIASGNSINYKLGIAGGGYYQAGDPNFTDVNGDYVIDDDDRMVLGNSQPIVTGGFNTTVAYKGFSFSLNGSFTLKRDIINAALSERLSNLGRPFSQYAIVPVTGLNYWQNPGDVATFSNPYNYTRYSPVAPFRVNQSLFQEDGSYFKINTLSIGYTSKKIAQILGLQQVRIYFSANNLAIFSNYSGPSAESVTSLGYDNSNGYPNAHLYNMGFNIEL